jgi:tetratricopeptide (TPR) repeat protein
MTPNSNSPTHQQGAFERGSEERARLLFHQAYQLHTQGKFRDAIRLYTKSISTYPTAEAHTFLGWAYSHFGNFKQAIEECKRAIDLDAEYGNPYNDIGAYLLELGNTEEAEYWLQRALHAPRYETPFFSRFNLGRMYQRQGKWFEAIQEFREAYNMAQERGIEYHAALQAYLQLQAALN